MKKQFMTYTTSSHMCSVFNTCCCFALFVCFIQHLLVVTDVRERPVVKPSQNTTFITTLTIPRQELDTDAKSDEPAPTFPVFEDDLQNRVYIHPDNTRVRLHNGWLHVAASRFSSLIFNRAYVDNRNGSNAIRIFGAYIQKTSNRRTLKRSIVQMIKYCSIWYEDDLETPEVSSPTVFFFDRKLLRLKRLYLGIELTISCPLNTTRTPTKINVKMKVRGDSRYSINVTHIANKTQPPFDVGICVPMLYGNISDEQSMQVVEWIEVHRMFGVQEFNMYNVSLQHVSPKFLQVLQYYASRNIIRWTNVEPPYDVTIEEDVYNISKIIDGPVLNQCYYDNLHRYRYFLVLDLDEVLVPKVSQSIGNNTYRSLIQYLETKYPSNDTASYTAQFSFFYQHLKTKLTMPRYYMALRFFQALPPSTKYRMKSLTNPEYCVCIYLHYCLQSIRGAAVYRAKQLSNRSRGKVGREFVKKPKSSIRVLPTEMLVHHYRTHCYLKRYSAIPLEAEKAQSSCGAVAKHTKTNNYMKRYNETVVLRVTSVLKRLQLI